MKTSSAAREARGLLPRATRLRPWSGLVPGLTLGLALAGSGCRSARLDLAHPDPALAYVSDYLSFVGEDARGRVCFALDTNRGRDGDARQLEHAATLYDEERGWIALAGAGVQPEPTETLEALPAAGAFAFQGTPREGVRVSSPANRLALAVEPLRPLVEHRARGAWFWMGAEEAELSWNGRVLTGRVIYEFLSVPGFNRITRVYPGLWREFQALYLRLEPAGDLYFHVQSNPALEELLGPAPGFLLDPQGRLHVLERITLTQTEHRQALGFYRWPVGWSGTLGADGAFTLELVERRGISNWIVGGFAMGVARGTVSLGGERWPAFGLAELLE